MQILSVFSTSSPMGTKLSTKERETGFFGKYVPMAHINLSPLETHFRLRPRRDQGAGVFQLLPQWDRSLLALFCNASDCRNEFSSRWRGNEISPRRGRISYFGTGGPGVFSDDPKSCPSGTYFSCENATHGNGVPLEPHFKASALRCYLYPAGAQVTFSPLGKSCKHRTRAL